MKTKNLISYLKNNFFSILLILLFSFLYQCQKNDYITISGFTQGTTFKIKYLPEIDTIPIKVIYSELNKIDSIFSLFQPNSIINRINNNDTSVKLCNYFLEAFKIAKKIYYLTDGYYDPTVTPILENFNFIPKHNLITNPKTYDSLKEFIGFDKVKIINNKILKPKNVKLDFNGIIQGYTVDRLAFLLESYGIRNYIIEIGGEIKMKGLNEKKEKWKIGIEKPTEKSNIFNREIIDVLELTNCAVSTSGTYRQYIEKDGKKLSHIINPYSASCVYSEFLSATIITSSCAEADGIATALIAMGIYRAKNFLYENPKYKGYLIYFDDYGRLKTWKSFKYLNL